jgi:hypothetical protein
MAAAEYYESLAPRSSLSHKFSDIDDADNFAHCRQMLANSSTRNFVLDFGDEDAWCGFDLTNDDFEALVNSQVRLSIPFQKGERQVTCIELTIRIETEDIWNEMDVSVSKERLDSVY